MAKAKRAKSKIKKAVSAKRPRVIAGRERGQACDILVTNATVITVDGHRRVFAKGAIAIQGRRIAAVGPERDIAKAWRGKRVIDAGGGTVHPGFIDPHVHIVHGTCRGIYGDAARAVDVKVNFADWKADVRPKEEHAAAVFSGLEMLHNGFTCFIEPGSVFDCDEVADATEKVGIRGLLAGTYVWDQVEIMKYLGALDSKTLYARSKPKLERCLDDLGSQLHRNKDKDALVRGFVMLYGTGTASDELEKAAAALARDKGAPFHQHESYLPGAYDFDRSRLGYSRLQHLHKIGVLDENASLIHMNVIQDDDVPAIMEANATLVWCPYAYLRSGMSDHIPCRIPEMLQNGVNVALAIDGTMDATVGNAAGAAFLAAGNAKATITPEDIIEMQTIRAARSAGMEREIGSIEAGKRADIVIRGARSVESYPATNPVHQLALLQRAGSVDTVIVDGKVVFKDGRSTRVDEEKAYATVKKTVEDRVKRSGLSSASTWPVVR